ncbi:MAG: nucleotidyl transferase AbiEii/AbiGii toxin family protein [Victivallales bacterium]
MISKGFLIEWQETAPWNTQAMIEQDLIISRAIVEIFSHPLLAEHLAFRGGTALHKLEELLGTKMRALYQRRKGRDLFDLWIGLAKGKANPDIIVKCFRKYMEASGLRVSAKEYRMNMEAKINLPEFRSDTEDLLCAAVEYPIDEAYGLFDKEILSVLEKRGNI